MSKNAKEGSSKQKNNDRANNMNPNNPAYKAGQDNRANQLNPNHRESKSNK